MDKKLEKILLDIKDINDPESLEKLQPIIDRLEAQDTKYMKLLVSKVENESIRWERPWYQSVVSITRPPDRLERTTQQFLKGRFTKVESEILEANWEEFRKEYNLPDTPICLFRWKNRHRSRNPALSSEERARHFAVAYLAQGLERNLYQVYLSLVSKYAAPVTGAYSRLEKKTMEICFEHNPEQAVPCLAALLGRNPTGISKKYKEWRDGKDEPQRRRWGYQSATEFVESLTRHSKKHLSELEHSQIDESVWSRVQRDLKHPLNSLKKYWYTALHTQLYVRYDIRMSDLREKILNILSVSREYEVWSDIRWKKVLEEFPRGFTHLFLYKITYKLVYKYQGYRRAPLRDVIKHARAQLRSDRINHHRVLRTLYMNAEGRLQRYRHTLKWP